VISGHKNRFELADLGETMCDNEYIRIKEYRSKLILIAIGKNVSGNTNER
jgi:hypothetical protein